jgi:hypothetical protein
MWNASLMQSQAMLSQSWPWLLSDTSIDVGAWFGLCAALGVALSWLRSLDAPAETSTLGRTGVAHRTRQLARA